MDLEENTMDLDENIDEILDLFFDSDSNDDNFLSSSEDSLSSNCFSSELDDTDSDTENNILERRKLARCTRFVEDTVQRYDDIEFRSHFRMSRNTCYFIINKIKEAKILPTHTFGRQKVSAEKSFLLTLWYLSNQESYRQIADRFDVTISKAFSCIKVIIKYLVQISSDIISWPSLNELNEIEENFYKIQKIRGVIGAIDGSHIKIPKPGKNQHAYCNCKNEHSILLQGVCDDKKRFRDVFCGEAGSIHDARLLKRSKLYECISAGHLIPNNYFLLGDSAYPSLSWLIPPFKDNGSLTANQKIFNYKHSSTRIVIENAFGLLKGRFRRLKAFENIDLEFITEAVVAACVLHNICINFDDLQIAYDPEEENNIDDYAPHYEEFERSVDRRQQIFQEMFNN